MKLLLSCTMLALAACSQRDFRPPPGYALIASLQVTDDAFEGPVGRFTGTQFYLDRGSVSSGPSLVVYSFIEGRVTETLGGGIDQSEMERIVKAMPTRPFDLAKRISQVDARLRRDSKSRGILHEPPIVLDGWKLKTIIITRHGPMEFTEWNPGPIVSFYSKHDPMIMSVNSYLDVLAMFKGRSSLGL